MNCILTSDTTYETPNNDFIKGQMSYIKLKFNTRGSEFEVYANLFFKFSYVE